MFSSLSTHFYKSFSNSSFIIYFLPNILEISLASHRKVQIAQSFTINLTLKSQIKLIHNIHLHPKKEQILFKHKENRKISIGYVTVFSSGKPRLHLTISLIFFTSFVFISFINSEFDIIYCTKLKYRCVLLS